MTNGGTDLLDLAGGEKETIQGLILLPERKPSSRKPLEGPQGSPGGGYNSSYHQRGGGGGTLLSLPREAFSVGVINWGKRLERKKKRTIKHSNFLGGGGGEGSRSLGETPGKKTTFRLCKSTPLAESSGGGIYVSTAEE